MEIYYRQRLSSAAGRKDIFVSRSPVLTNHCEKMNSKKFFGVDEEIFDDITEFHLNSQGVDYTLM
jgi:hypothetical protein